MGITFTPYEVLDIAIGIEVSGATFYESLAQSATEIEAQSVYQGLAAMERQHQKIFQDMQKAFEKYEPPALWADDYYAYLKGLVDSSVFKDDRTAREMAAKVTSDSQAIQIAIGAEKDSILFYLEMRDFVPSAQSGAVDKIIDEERSHLRMLSGLKR